MKTVVQPATVWDPQGRYAQALLLSKPGKLLFIAGQTAVDERGEVVGKGDVEAQTKRVLDNMKAILAAAGGSFGDLVKITTYVTDAQHLSGMYSARQQYFVDGRPTSTTVVVQGLAREEFLVEMEAIAVLPDS
jgi:reactive intermediate/imine deaminase